MDEDKTRRYHDGHRREYWLNGIQLEGDAKNIQAILLI
jgi:hypothetical protein